MVLIKSRKEQTGKKARHYASLILSSRSFEAFAASIHADVPAAWKVVQTVAGSAETQSPDKKRRKAKRKSKK